MCLLTTFAITAVDNFLHNQRSYSQTSTLCVFALSFINRFDIVFIREYYWKYISASDIAYVENLLNLSIAGAYPICFLVMSGEMKRFELCWFVRI